jgi:hypothetical protein
MGWTPVNKMTIERDFKTREIIIKWHDDQLGDKEKRFPFEKQTEALCFASTEFKQVCM